MKFPMVSPSALSLMEAQSLYELSFVNLLYIIYLYFNLIKRIWNPVAVGWESVGVEARNTYTCGAEAGEVNEMN